MRGVKIVVQVNHLGDSITAVIVGKYVIQLTEDTAWFRFGSDYLVERVIE